MEASYCLIDEKKWARAEHFRHFWDEAPCSISMCDEINVTQLRRVCKELHRSFSIVVLYAVTYVVNSHEEFRMLTVDSPDAQFMMPAIWDEVHPSHNIFHSDTETYTSLFTKWDEDFEIFAERCEEDMKRAERLRVMAIPGLANTFEASCVPWRHFTSVGVHGDLYSLAPIIAWGGFRENGDDVYMPLSIQIHHAAADGYHLARFISETETVCADLARSLSVIEKNSINLVKKQT